MKAWLKSLANLADYHWGLPSQRLPEYSQILFYHFYQKSNYFFFFSKGSFVKHTYCSRYEFLSKS